MDIHATVSRFSIRLLAKIYKICTYNQKNWTCIQDDEKESKQDTLSDTGKSKSKSNLLNYTKRMSSINSNNVGNGKLDLDKGNHSSVATNRNNTNVKDTENFE